jgi:putative flippase GtrA
MSVTQFARLDGDEAPATSDVDIVIPVYNEAEQLATSITRLRTYLDSAFPFETTITIADNASTDGSGRIAADLAATLPGVRALHLDQKGRGRALRAAWSTSTASVVAYMDVDLATGLDALLPLVAPLLSGHSDVAIGTRLAPGAHVVRGTQREFLSRGYNLLLRSALRSTCTDAQCGFKAMRRQAAEVLLPLVEDNEWFFDTEVLVTAQRVGLRIHEVPVDWVDDLDSRVEVVPTALKDLRGMWRMLGPSARRRAALHLQPATSASVEALPRSPARDETEATGTRSPEVFADELLRFAGVGAISTVAYLGLFAVLEPTAGSYAANAIAIGLCSLGNTAAHRGMADTAGHGLDPWRRAGVAAALLGISLAFTTAALAATRAAGLNSLAPELAAVTVANLAASVIRFGILRTWVFRPEFGAHLPAAAHPPTLVAHPGTLTETSGPR